MSFFRQYIAPVLIVLMFLVAMIAVSARIFLPSDLAAPAPIEEPSAMHQDAVEQAIANSKRFSTSATLAQFSPFSPASAHKTVQNG